MADHGTAYQRTLTVLDPTGERASLTRPRIDRPASLDKMVVALLDISKPRGNVFLDRVETRLNEQGLQTKRYAKPTFTKPAPVDLRERIAAECGAVIEALAD
jgi:hypothetical protein